ncbi:MAG: hypothetical protein FWD97_04585 [Defluviitaleaceae bacterium]|nr:hypothetical protein [Defluviitaleaceae bacterium]
MIVEKALEQGIRVKIVPLDVLERTKVFFQRFLTEQPLDDFQKMVITEWHTTDIPPDLGFEPKSVVVTAWNCIENTKGTADCESLLSDAGAKFHNVPGIPKKFLAASLGMAGYGKNNVLMFEGWGGFGRIGTFLTDIEPPANYHWQEVVCATICDDCSICVDNCPSGALDAKRFLIHASKCLNVNDHNENVCFQCHRICPTSVEILEGRGNI